MFKYLLNHVFSIETEDMMIKRPILAERAEELTDIVVPCIGTPKLDGYRCLKIDGDVVSRNFKPIRNIYTRAELRKMIPDGMDGELMLRGENAFNAISSAFSGFKGEPDFVFHVFDWVKDDPNKPYVERLKDLEEWFMTNNNDHITLVPYTFLETLEDVVKFEDKCFKDGYEGSMYRTPNGKYKAGRSTLKEQILLKKKRWHDSEGIIIGFTEQETNENEKEINELGLTKRSTKKAGKVLAGTLGNIILQDPTFPGEEVEVGTGLGLTKEFRQEIWNNRDSYMGKVVNYKYQKEGGVDKPRFPTMRGIRDISDLDSNHPILHMLKPHIDASTEEERKEALDNFFESF